MTERSLRSRFDVWQIGAPWGEWSPRRRVAVALLFCLPVLVGGFAVLGALDTSFCGVWGGQCTPEEEQEIRVLSTIFWASYVVIVGSFAVLFLLRRRVFWMVATVLGLLGFLDVLL